MVYIVFWRFEYSYRIIFRCVCLFCLAYWIFYFDKIRGLEFIDRSTIVINNFNEKERLKKEKKTEIPFFRDCQPLLLYSLFALFFFPFYFLFSSRFRFSFIPPFQQFFMKAYLFLLFHQDFLFAHNFFLHPKHFKNAKFT